ncbi:MAG: AhpC/TSA family protein [Duncaniella sp.]|nr:AhpC/TSA family protein [Duncaniella sp.]
MNFKTSLLTGIFALGLGACATAGAPDYTVTFPAGEDFDDTMAYILNYDSGAKIDSVIVADGQVKFSGNISEPVLARLIIDGNRGPVFILEKGNISINDKGDATGSALNERMNSYGEKLAAIMAEANSLPEDSTSIARMAELEKEYYAVPAQAMKENADNPIGLYFFLQQAYELNLAELDAAVASNPMLADSKRVASLRTALLAEAETSEGKKFKDFAVTYDGKTERLSDYVGKGKYVLVDFWASWCGPCMREIATLKKIREEYGQKGLEILGVAVWDEPANTLKAIEQQQIPWHSIIDAQTIPTDIYGISGIPCIILFGPDGTILSRGLQGQNLINAVAAAMASAEPAANAAPAAVAE